MSVERVEGIVLGRRAWRKGERGSVGGGGDRKGLRRVVGSFEGRRCFLADGVGPVSTSAWKRVGWSKELAVERREGQIKTANGLLRRTTCRLFEPSSRLELLGSTMVAERAVLARPTWSDLSLERGQGRAEERPEGGRGINSLCCQ